MLLTSDDKNALGLELAEEYAMRTWTGRYAMVSKGEA
jgi:hypothetical protein